MTTACVTMVYNDPVFLDIWVRYYAKHTDRANLHIITHGPGQDYAYDIGHGCVISECPRDPLNPRLDQDRFVWITEYCARLTETHTRVICNDVDEIVVLDPECGDDLFGYIESFDPSVQVITPLGLEIVHQKYRENDYDYTRGLFNQRRWVRMNGWYSKPCITNTPVVWGPDGHGSSHPAYHLDDNLYLFHLKWFDDQFHLNRHKDRLKLRFKDDAGEEVIVGAGSWSWSEMTYQLVTNSFLRQSFDKHGLGFDFTDQKTRMRDGFGPGAPGLYKTYWFVDGDFRELPERFIGMI